MSGATREGSPPNAIKAYDPWTLDNNAFAIRAAALRRDGVTSRALMLRDVSSIDVDSRHHDGLLSANDIMANAVSPDLLRGTVDLLILRTLQTEPMHGWAMSERIQQISQDALQLNQGSLYPALHRLEHQGWIKAEWKTSELGRRAKYYRLTTSGKRQLEIEAGEWARLATAVGRVMKLA